MKTKTKNIVAILMASIIAMAIAAVPMAMGQGTGTGASVGNAPPSICYLGMDPGTEFSLNLCPDPTTVRMVACVCDPNSNEDIASVTAETPKGIITLDRHPELDWACGPPDHPERVCEPAPTVNCTLYEGYFDMDCCDEAGDYQIVFTATDKQGESDEELLDFTVLSMIYLSMDFDEIDFGSVEMCKPECVYGDGDMGTSGAPTIHNLGNDPMVITIHATKMTGLGGDIDMELDANVPGTGVCEDGTYLPPCEEICFDHVFECCVKTPIDFSIHVPYGTLPGPYVGTITITGSHPPCPEE